MMFEGGVQKPYEFIWFLEEGYKNHRNSYDFWKRGQNTIWIHMSFGRGVKQSYEFIWLLNPFSKIIWIHIVFGHHLQTSYEFLWFLYTFFKHHMNSYGFCNPFSKLIWIPMVFGPLFQKSYEFLLFLYPFSRTPFGANPLSSKGAPSPPLHSDGTARLPTSSASFAFVRTLSK